MKRVRVSPRDFADLIKPVDRNHILMSSDLQHGIRGRVENRMGSFKVFGSQLFEDNGSAAREIADERNSRFRFDRLHEFVRKSIEDRKRLLENDTGNFPMAGGRILAG